MPILDLLGFLLTGVLSGLLAGLFGVGGGTIMVPALIFLFGHLGIGGDWVPQLAIGTSLATIIGTGAASALAHHRRGAVRWDLVAGLAPGIVFGTWGAAVVAGWLPGLWLKRLFAGFLTYVGVRILVPGRAVAHRPMPGRAGLWAVGGGIGALSALVGIGGGTLTVPFLARCGLDLRHAVGTSAACGLPIAIAGAIGYMVVGWGRAGLPAASTGFVYWPAVVLMLLASMPAAPLGARLAHTLPVDLLKRAFGVFLLLIAARLAFG
ncbi:sulfite exporter TauE/SafE family protein [uncultured Thiodictyon sp.]|uniref:sulfite exporter TauE/SafE family protein n=1 Tax=uncultured Thiodictyon sp. TaxID=1846217 RepID=UPI0025F44BB5|nr:sulfite exporter TauE/SafE family protein [uncultured Thiodictyon sp.]